MSEYRFVSREPIEKGWSGDRKYRVTDAEGRVYLYRVSPIAKREKRERGFAQMREIAALGVPMSVPYEFGVSEEGVWLLQEYIDGEDAETVLPTLSVTEQYRYGTEAGQILRRIHTLAAPKELSAWEERYGKKIDRKLAAYEACPLKYESDTAFLTFIASHRDRIKGRPQTYQHGDYHVGNMMIDRSGALRIIDFDRDDYGDPWEEFNRIVWCVGAPDAPAYVASGMIDGYFGGDVPNEFWELLALYVSVNTLSSLPWAIPFGEGEIETMRRQAREVLLWYDGMRCIVPRWYARPVE